MSRAIRFLAVAIAFALFHTDVCADPIGSESSDELAERLSTTDIDAQAIMDVVRLLGSANTEEFEKGRQTVLKMWFSGGTETRCRALHYMCQPHVRIANIKEILLSAFENETDLQLLNCVGKALGSQVWSDEEYLGILDLSLRLNKLADDSPDPYSYEIKQNAVKAATAGKGSGAYPLLVQFAQQNPDIKGVPDNWVFTLIASRNPRGFRDGLEAMRKSDSDFNVIPYITHLRNATKVAFRDESELLRTETCYQDFMDDLEVRVRDANKSPKQRVYALDALKSLGEYSSPTLAVAYNIANSDPELWRLALADNRPDQRRKAIRLIGQLDVVNQIEPLKQIVLHDADPSTRETALFALREIPGPECTLALEDMMRQTPDGDRYKGKIRQAWREQKTLAPTVLPKLRSTDPNKEPTP